MSDSRADEVSLAERILFLLEQGKKTATYKYAVLLGLLDLSLERTSAKGEPPETITTRQLAQKIIELYWPQVRSYFGRPDGALLQNSGTQAAILRRIEAFQRDVSDVPNPPLREARRHTEAFQTLVDDVEWVLIQMPLPKLQRVGQGVTSVLYAIGWEDDIAEGRVRAYQRGQGEEFDNRIQLLPGVGSGLVRLNGILRPLLHRKWAAMVARLNHLEESRLEEFLFDAARDVPKGVGPRLRELQRNECFYCRDRIEGATDVDHFLPFSRYPDNNIANLVLAHARCNGNKLHHLAAAEHVETWAGRNFKSGSFSSDLARIAEETGCDSRPEATMAVARATYLRLPSDVRLWHAVDDFRPLDRATLERVFMAS